MAMSLPAPRRVWFAGETKGDPLAAFPSLTRDGLPYNRWLTEQVLDPVLARWLVRTECGPGGATGIAEDVAWVSDRCRGAFRELLPAAVSAGDPALLAALGVTANLQRTGAVLGEFLFGGGRLAAGGTSRSPGVFRLSRLWCGLIEYTGDGPYFPARVHPPIHAGLLNVRRRDSRHLANALWCSLSAIASRCEEATFRLREAIHKSGLFEPGDLQHLRGPSVSLRTRGRK